jgi:dihydroorotate dehydrogenase electron transfer subunit
VGDELMQREYSGLLVENYKVAEDCHLFTIESRDLKDAEPGQFIHVLPRAGHQVSVSSDPLLRRPISIYDIDEEQKTLKILFRVVGRGTKALSMLSPGELIDFLGPIGRGFELPTTGGCELALVGGGIGLAPLFLLARRLIQAGHRVRAFFGFRSQADCIDVGPFSEIGCAVEVFTEDGSLGVQGFPTQGLVEALPGLDGVYACGPVGMLAAVARFARDLPCQVSMEERMGCGVGACLACACKVKGQKGYVRVCVDGPVFNAAEIDFDHLLGKQR